MAFLVWSSTYEFGIEEIDSQHKRWLEILNNFYDHLSEGQLKSKLISLLDEAIEYTLFHFASEETFMATMGYPHIDDQKKMHQNIASLLTDFKKDALNDKIIVSTIVTKELKKWFNEHILIEDMKYAEFFKSKK